MAQIQFTVLGRPQQRGSKIAAPIPKRGGGWVQTPDGRPVVAARDMNPKSKDWMHSVRAAAHEAYDGPLLHGPISLSVGFFFRRPKSHYRTGKFSGQLKDSAPEIHAQSPDLAKLVRCLEDALTGVVWHDDRQVWFYRSIHREWTEDAERAVVSIVENVVNE